MIRRVAINFKLPFSLKKRKAWYVASCPLLDVFTQGKTQKQAKENLVEALTLFIGSCIERNTLDSVLKECGFSQMSHPSPSVSADIINRQNYVDVPIPFRVDSAGIQHCHA